LAKKQKISQVRQKVAFFLRGQRRGWAVKKKKSIARAAQNFFQFNYFIGHRAILRAILRVSNPFSN
jgi:hypothetical protein